MHSFRSPFRLFVVGLVGVILIIVAIDIMFIHAVATEPDGSPGPLTTKGLAQQRGDIIWGAALIGMGVVLAGSAIVELVRRKPAVDVRDDGLYAQIGAQNPDVLIPWSAVETVSSGVSVDPFDGSLREKLIVQVRDDAAIPEAISGAEWHGANLHIDAHDWNRSVTDIALAAQGARDYAMRPPTPIATEREPSMMWETRVDVTTQEPASDIGTQDAPDEPFDDGVIA